MAKKTKILKPYKSYSFRGQDPIVSKVLDQVDGTSFAAVSRDSGVASTTLGNWRSAKTKRPQFATLNATLMALGKEFTIVNKK
jgi:transposase-like protein